MRLAHALLRLCGAASITFGLLGPAYNAMFLAGGTRSLPMSPARLYGA